MRPSVCYVAPYDPSYSRNRDTIRAFQATGVRVEVVRGPRIGGLRAGNLVLLRAILAGLLVITSAIWRVIDISIRLLRCRALVVGYLGQLDVLLLAPMAHALGRPVIFSPLVTITDTVVEDRGLVPAGSPIAWLIRLVDRQALRAADLVLSDTRENARFAAKLARIPLDRFVEFPVGVDENVFRPRSEATKVDGNDKPLDVLFYGTFIPLHGVETIICAAAQLQSETREVKFEMIGTGQRYASARKLANRLEISNITWTDWLPYNDLGQRLREADVVLGVFDGGAKASRVIPNKVHQALAAGVPVVTRHNPAIARLLRDRRSAMLVAPDDPVALAEAIQELGRNPRLRRSIAKNGRAAWESYASHDQLAAHARTILDRAGVQA